MLSGEISFEISTLHTLYSLHMHPESNEDLSLPKLIPPSTLPYQDEDGLHRGHLGDSFAVNAMYIPKHPNAKICQSTATGAQIKL
jgi:hypothetical protein